MDLKMVLPRNVVRWESVEGIATVLELYNDMEYTFTFATGTLALSCKFLGGFFSWVQL